MLTSFERADGDLALAIEIADIADEIAGRRFRAPDLIVDSKPNGSPICDADRAIEEAVSDTIRHSEPDVLIFGGEHGPRFRGESDYWAIDPIDGTASFIAGRPGWGFTACRVRDGLRTAGVASSVGLRKRWWAGHGAGAFQGDLETGAATQATVSLATSVSTARIGWWDGWRTEAPGRTSLLDASVAALQRTGADVRPSGAAALAVATGALDAAVMRSPDEGPWHMAAFEVIVEGAGGAVAAWREGCLLLSNGRLHDEILSLLTAV